MDIEERFRRRVDGRSPDEVFASIAKLQHSGGPSKRAIAKLIPMLQFITICIAAAGIPGGAQEPAPRISAKQAKRFLGKDATLCGTVVNYGCDWAKETVLLHLDENLSGGVAIGVRSVQRPGSGERFEDEYLWANVCATGRVERLSRRYVIVVDPPQALVIEGRKRPRAAPFAPNALHPCSSDVELPVVIREVQPTYTTDALRAMIQGRMLLHAVVLRDGTVGDVRVMRSLDTAKGLDEQGIAAVRRWRFMPGRLRGETVPMIVTVELTFRLE
jgi:TonB family protein